MNKKIIPILEELVIMCGGQINAGKIITTFKKIEKSYNE